MAETDNDSCQLSRGVDASVSSAERVLLLPTVDGASNNSPMALERVSVSPAMGNTCCEVATVVSDG